MPLSDHLSFLLNTEQLPESWYLSYGLTKTRTSSLTSAKYQKTRYDNSFLNGNSETACTLFMLGFMDRWVQTNQDAIIPRNINGWNPSFFRFICRDAPDNQQVWNYDSPFRLWIANLLGVSAEQTSDAVLLFEYEMRNRALSASKNICLFSFLNLTQKSWCLSDAIILLPRLRRLVTVESKLSSDMSRDTSTFLLISQAIRGWESTFMLTRCKESLLCGWEFQNILLCPRKPFEYRAAYYSYVYNAPEDHVRRYRSILEREYADSLNRERFNHLFDDFQQSIASAVSVIHWDELALCVSTDSNWTDNYLTQIREKCECDGDEVCHAADTRFRLAGIERANRA